MIEYGALVVLIAVILFALVPLIPGPLAHGINDRICRIFGGSCPAKRQAKPPNYLPVRCTAQAETDKTSAQLNLKVLRFGDKFSVLRQKLANGQVWLTVVPVDYSAGGHWNPYRGKRGRIDVGVDASLQMGSTYWFESDDQANKFVDQVETREKRKNPMYWVVPSTWTHNASPKLPGDGKPEITNKQISLSGTGSLNVNLSPSQPQGKHAKPTRTSLQASAGADVKVGGQVNYEHWHQPDPDHPGKYDNSHSYTYKVSGSFNAHASGGVTAGNKSASAGAYYGQGWSGAVRYMYGDDGKLQSIRWITTYDKLAGAHAGAGRTANTYQGRHRKNAPRGKPSGSLDLGGRKGTTITRMTQLNFDNAAERKVGENYIHAHGAALPIPIENMITGKTNAVTDDPGPNADPMTKLMYQKGKSWDWKTNDTKSSVSYISTALFAAAASKEQKDTKSAEYLGAPKNGHRSYVPFKPCTYGNAPKSHDKKLDG